MTGLSIGEVARQAGVATSTIRYYERIGLLPKVRQVNGRRKYEPNILQKLGTIRLAQQAGLTLANIQRLLHEFPSHTPPAMRWQTVAPHRLAELDAIIERTQAMKALLEKALACTCETLEECGRMTEGEIVHERAALMNDKPTAAPPFAPVPRRRRRHRQR
jgi:MerR family redox-sensitive transcriptional activator SoxR